MSVSTLRRTLRARVGLAVLAAVTAAAGQLATGAPARAQAPSRPAASAVAAGDSTVFPADSAPATADSGDGASVVVGVKVIPSVAGWIDGVRFYKSSANVGVHTGTLWSSGGTSLATGTFADETPSGWQTLLFANPVPVKAGATYVASYLAPSGHYAADAGYFLNGPAGRAPITAPADGSSGGNGVYTYDGPSAFPASSANAANYWVDVLFTDANVPATPTITAATPANGATGVSTRTTLTATFSAPMDPATVRFSLRDNASLNYENGTVKYDAASRTATFTPNSDLAAGALYVASVSATDAWGHTDIADLGWTFTTSTAPPSYTCPCSLFDTSAKPAVDIASDPHSVELGVVFAPAVDGTITAIRFYKGNPDPVVHTGTLWTRIGHTELATGTFTNETTTGWQTLTFAQPVHVTAGQYYVASYHVPGGYSYTPNYFGNTFSKYPLSLPTIGLGGYGVYTYGDSTVFPGFVSLSAVGVNYWVDVVFTTP